MTEQWFWVERLSFECFGYFFQTCFKWNMWVFLEKLMFPPSLKELLHRVSSLLKPEGKLLWIYCVMALGIFYEVVVSKMFQVFSKKAFTFLKQVMYRGGMLQWLKIIDFKRIFNEGSNSPVWKILGKKWSLFVDSERLEVTVSKVTGLSASIVVQSDIYTLTAISWSRVYFLRYVGILFKVDQVFG